MNENAYQSAGSEYPFRHPVNNNDLLGTPDDMILVSNPRDGSSPEYFELKSMRTPTGDYAYSLKNISTDEAEIRIALKRYTSRWAI